MTARCGIHTHNPASTALKWSSDGMPALSMEIQYTRKSSVTPMFADLGWEPLTERRAKAKAAMMFRIRNDLVDIERER